MKLGRMCRVILLIFYRRAITLIEVNQLINHALSPRTETSVKKFIVINYLYGARTVGKMKWNFYFLYATDKRDKYLIIVSGRCRIDAERFVAARFPAR